MTGNGISTAAHITDYEAAHLEETNAPGLTPVVFIHGLWLLPGPCPRHRPKGEFPWGC